jgi:hypothetical protein
MNFLEMLSQDEEIPFSFQDSGPAEGDFAPGGLHGMQVREGVDAGVDVIDLAAMRHSLEEARRKRLEGG